MKTTTRAERNMFGKLTGNYVAEFGPWQATGTTKEEALFILSEQLEQLQRHEHTTRYLVTKDGVVFILRHTFGGWGYDIVHTKGACGSAHGSSCLLACKSFVDAYAAMKTHWEQMDADCVANAAS